MPPKTKITKLMIIDASINIIKEQGFENINARNIAKYLNCSTCPIFTCYENMEDLKQNIIEQLNSYYNTFMEENMTEDNRLLTQSIAYVDFARKENQIFNALFMNKTCAGFSLNDIINADWNQDSIINAYKITGLDLPQAQALFRDIWIYAHGIATQIVANKINLPREEVINLITNAFNRFSAKGILDERQ